MSAANDSVTLLLRTLLPVGDGRFQLLLPDSAATQTGFDSAGYLLAPLQLVVFDADGAVFNVFEATCVLAGPADAANVERLSAYLRAWARALPKTVAGVLGERLEDAWSAADLVYPQLLADPALQSEADFEAAFANAEHLRALLEAQRRAFTERPPVTTSWEGIEEWLAEQAPVLAASLRAGATEDELDGLALDAGMALPQDFVEAWRRHDGQSRDGGGLVLSEYNLLPIAEIRRQWAQWRLLNAEGAFVEASAHVQADTGVARTWYHPGWMPFATNAAGDALCIDLAPESGGLVGQIVRLNHDEPTRSRPALSLRELLSDLDALLAEGLLVHSDIYGGLVRG